MIGAGEGWRTCPSAQTVASLRRHLSRFGITRVADVTGLDRIGVPVVMVVRPDAASLAVAQGKGLTLDDARASGLMEAIETWHAEHLPNGPETAAPETLARDGRAALDLARLPAQKGVPVPPGLPLPWIEGVDLLAGDAPVLVPYPLVHRRYVVPPEPGSGLLCASSNGLASGNTREEAVLHALSEVIERDAVAIWSGLPAAARLATRLRLDGIEHPALRGLLDRLEAADMAVGVWDATSDVAVPVFHAEIVERGRDLPVFHEPPAAGDGCHPVREIALSRALTEAVQDRLTRIAGSRDDIDERRYRPAPGALDVLRRRLARPGLRAFTQAPSLRVGGIRAAVAALLDRLRRVGITQVGLVDLGRPETPEIAVVRLVVPGLEIMVDHPHRRPGPRAAASLVAAGWTHETNRRTERTNRAND